MSRDFDIIRKVLLNPKDYSGVIIKDDRVAYNIKLMIDGELITGKMLVDGNDYLFNGVELKDKGLDLLSYIGDDYVWNEIKKRTDEKGLDYNLPQDILKSLADKIIKELLF